MSTAHNSGWASPALLEITPNDGARGPVLVWRFPYPLRAISSAIVGGGIRCCNWILNMTVDPLYSRLDTADHIAEVAAVLGLEGNGVGLLTAVDVGVHTIECQSEVDGKHA